MSEKTQPTTCKIYSCVHDRIANTAYCETHLTEFMAVTKNDIVNGINYKAIIDMDGNIDLAAEIKYTVGFSHPMGTTVCPLCQMAITGNYCFNCSMSSDELGIKDMVNSPSHYNSLGAECEKCNEPIECITVSETLPANLAQALQYVWRCEFKGEKVKDIKKAIWFLQRELKRIAKKQEEKQQ